MPERAPDRTRRPQAAAPSPFVAPEVWTERLPSGAVAVGTPRTAVPATTVQVRVPAGGLREREETLGAASLVAELLEEGTEGLDGTALVDALDGLGATLEAGADEDGVVVVLTALDRHLERAAALLEDLVLAPRFDGRALERVRARRLVELESRRARPDQLAADAWRGVLFEGVRALPPVGTPASVAALDRDALAGFWRAGVASGGLRIAVVGSPRPGDVARLLPRLASEAPPTAEPLPPADLRPARRLGEVELHLVDRPGAPQAQVHVGHGGPAATDPDFYPLHAATLPLGGVFSSRLNRVLREEKGWTYGASAGWQAGLAPGWFRASAAVETGAAADAVDEVLRQVAAYAADGPSAEEASAATATLARTLRRQYASADARRMLVDRIARFGWPPDYPARRLAWLEAVGRDELAALAAARLEPDRAAVVVVGDAERVRGPLEALGRGPARTRDSSVAGSGRPL